MASCPVPTDVTITLAGAASNAMILDGQSVEVGGSVTHGGGDPDCTVDLLFQVQPPSGPPSGLGSESSAVSEQVYTHDLTPSSGPGQYAVTVQALYKNDSEDVIPSLSGPSETLTLWVRSASEVAGFDAQAEERDVTAGLPERSEDAQAQERAKKAGVQPRSVDAQLPVREHATGFSGS